MPVAVVYAVVSKTIRRIVVSDENDLHVALVQGEALLEVPFKWYSQSNAQDLHDYVSSVIGPPEHDCRCVEVDKSGKVVAVYAADPAIDKPLYSPEFTVELSKDATIGDIKGGDGKFPPKPPPSQPDIPTGT